MSKHWDEQQDPADAALSDTDLDAAVGGGLVLTANADAPVPQRKQMLEWYKVMQEKGKDD